MKNDKILKELRNNTSFMPFNDAYNSEKVLSFFKDIYSKHIDYDVKSLSTLLSSKYISDLYKYIFENFRETQIKLGLSHKDIRKLLTSVSNRDIIISSFRLNEYVKRESDVKNIRKIEDFLAYKISDSSANTLELLSMGSQVTEVLNFCFKLLSKCEEAPEGENKVNDLNSYLYRLFSLGNIAYNLKDSYDHAVWENSFIIYNLNKNTMYMHCRDEHLAYIRRIGEIRFQKGVLGQHMHFGEPTLMNALIYEEYDSYSSQKSFSEISVINGEIFIKTDDGSSENTFSHFISFLSSRIVFYPFLLNSTLPNLYNFTIYEVHLILSKIKYIVYEAQELIVNSYSLDIDSDGGSDIYALRVRKLTLIDAITSITIFSQKQIENFISIFTLNNSHIDLWRTPLIEQDEYFLIPIVPISSQNSIFLTDHLLNIGGISLTDRGKHLEDFIKEEVKRVLNEKEYYFKISDRKNFKVNSNDSEEIDFILNTSQTLLIAEIKCISSPVDPRSSHNAFKILTKAAKQVKRKLSFISKYGSIFEDDIDSISNKEIVGLIIVNLPSFTGYVIDGIVIIDILSLNNYMNLGEFNNIKYYDNEEEFSKNIKQVFLNPAVVWNMKNYFKKHWKKITPERFEPQIFIEIIESNGDIIK